HSDTRALHSFPTRRSSDLDANFHPLFPQRGMPDDPSDTILKDIERWGEDGHSKSFMTLAELHRVNLDEEAIATDDRIHEYILKRSEEHTSELQSRFDLVCR